MRLAQSQHNIRFWLSWVVVVCLLPTCVASVCTIVGSYERERAALQLHAVEMARALMHAVDRELDGAIAALKVLATSPDLDEGDMRTFHRQARQVLLSEIGNGIVLADPGGQELVNTFKAYGEPLPRTGAPEFVRAIFQGAQPLVSNYYIGAGSGAEQVAVGVPVIRNGEVKYVLTMAIPPEHLAQILREQNAASDDVISIVDRGGTFVARTRNPSHFVGKKAPQGLLRRIVSESEGIAEGTTLDGIALTGGFSRSPSGWAVAMGIPNSRFTAGLYRSLGFSIGSAAALLLVALLMAGGVSLRIVRSIRALGAPADAHPIEIKEVAEVAHALQLRDEAREKAERAERIMAVAKEAAEQSNRAKSQFLTLMSHELRTPLNGILGFAQLIDGQYYGPLTPKQKEFTDAILHSGNHLLELINDVLELSKIESGRLTVSLERVDLLPVLKSVVANLQRLAEKAGIALSAGNFGLGMPPVLADHLRLAQCLLNLGSNAIKYNRPGGCVTLSCSLEGDRVRIGVNDTGIGIPSDRQGELFKPFNRLGAEQKAIEGTGVGLALTHRLVEQMGGEIGFESVEGAGSRFWIDMPVYVASQRDQEHGADVTIPSEAPQLAGFSVLYVEDNSANLTLMRNLFGTMHDIRLIEAVDGASGLAMAKEHHPDLIILDVNLPDTNGLSLLRQIRELNEFASTPVMALSSNAIPSSIKRGLDAGFCEYLTKPLDVNRFLKAVDAALAGARAARNTDAPARATMSA